jgi:hypothetical protein
MNEMRAIAENMIGVLAGIIIAGIFLSIAYQLLAGFGLEQQKKQAMASLNELASGVDYACGAGDGSSFVRTLALPIMVKEISGYGQKVCIVIESSHCIDTNCLVIMDPIHLNSTFFQTKARVSKDNTIGVEFEITRVTNGVEVLSRTVS